MYDSSSDMTILQEPLSVIESVLRDAVQHFGNLEMPMEMLREFSGSAAEASQAELASFALQLSGLLEIASLSSGDDERFHEFQEIIEFVIHSLPLLQQALNHESDTDEHIHERFQTAQDKWGEYLQVVLGVEESRSLEPWTAAENPGAADNHLGSESDGEGGGCDQIGMILTTLSAAESSLPNPEVDDEFPGDKMEKDADLDGDQPLDDNVCLDDEIREAYLDDAQRCLVSIETSLLAFEENPANRHVLQQVCRELHTLKGASASVGLTRLGSFLHRVEDDLQASCDENVERVDIELILRGVDLVRRQINFLLRDKFQKSDELSPKSLVPGSHQTEQTRTAVAERFIDSGPIGQDSVRVKAAQLDRLMDMLAGLVMLRNRRESCVEELKGVNSELVRCVSRLRAFEEGGESMGAAVGEALLNRSSGNVKRRQVSSLTEIANDLLDLGRNLRDTYEPIGEENLAISRFIRQFRQELMQLRRVPVRSLFTRLQRAARDAAKAENKKVSLHLVGQDVGLEKSVQEQLYDALLHIVRNAVSHGIEPESQRIVQGKPPAGVLSLEATGGSNLLVITVCDDGRGLDYDAIRRRGLEMGLISADRALSRTELAQLIFHPGFSTKSEASELSGRGVGMDVVANTLQQLQSWIEVDSVPGEGTSIQLMIPLHSVIEHVMVFRSAGQDYAVPTQFVKAAGPWNPGDAFDYPLIPFADVCSGVGSEDSKQSQVIVIQHGWKNSSDEQDAAKNGRRNERVMGLLVDEIVGPEEVVVRPLPVLLKDHRLFAGLSLSGTGEIMLLFDSQQLMDRGLTVSRDGDVKSVEELTKSQAPVAHQRALVVDDSRTSRRSLIQLLDHDRFLIDEAADGSEAVKFLNQHQYDIVFTDLEMPLMSGFDLLREIRSREAIAQIPVLMVSGRDEAVFQEKASKLGVTDYIVKPVSKKRLNSAMRRLKELGGNNT